MNGRTTRFKLDTEAAVTVLSDDVQWLQDVELTKTSQVLSGPGNNQLPMKGLFYTTLKYRESKLTEPIYVVHNQKCSLLSRRARVELGLIRRADKDVGEVNTGLTDYKAEFPALFDFAKFADFTKPFLAFSLCKSRIFKNLVFLLFLLYLLLNPWEDTEAFYWKYHPTQWCFLRGQLIRLNPI